MKIFPGKAEKVPSRYIRTLVRPNISLWVTDSVCITAAPDLQDKSSGFFGLAGGGPSRSAGFQPVSNLLYRRFPIGWPSELPPLTKDYPREFSRPSRQCSNCESWQRRRGVSRRLR